MGTKIKKKKEAMLTPQQQEFLSFYVDPKSETYGNAYQSALRAKYSDEYAKNMAARLPAWLSENVNKINDRFQEKVERNLNEFLDLNPREPVISMFGPVRDDKTGEIVERDNVAKMKLKLDATKFVAEGVDKRFSKQQGGVPGVAVQININEDREKFA